VATPLPGRPYFVGSAEVVKEGERMGGFEQRLLLRPQVTGRV
jgi:hypothetical protein